MSGSAVQTTQASTQREMARSRKNPVMHERSEGNATTAHGAVAAQSATRLHGVTWPVRRCTHNAKRQRTLDPAFGKRGKDERDVGGGERAWDGRGGPAARRLMSRRRHAAVGSGHAGPTTIGQIGPQGPKSIPRDPTVCPPLWCGHHRKCVLHR